MPESSARLFDELLPPEAVFVEATAEMWGVGLRPEEADCVSRAIDKRKREFTAGRNCARAALKQLGANCGSIRVGPNREPVLPPGISASITHTADYCAAAAIRIGDYLSLGIDAEPNRPLEGGLAEMICRPGEAIWIGRPAELDGIHGDKLIFSAKEAFYKAYFQACGRYLDFLDAEIRVLASRNRFQIAVLRQADPDWLVGRWIEGRYRLRGNLIGCAVCIPAPSLWS